jgi:hypothetical protein
MVAWKKLAYEADVITKALLTAAGDIIYASASATPAVLAKTTNGHVLTLTAGLPAWAAPAAPAAHAASHKNGGADELLLHELGEPTGDVECAGQEFNDFVLQKSAGDPATPVVAKAYFKSGDTGVYVCTSAA